MKVLERFEDVAEAEIVAESLRSRGILTHITSNPAAVMGLSPGMSARLWVVLPEQYLDAEKGLTDEDYQPFKPLTDDEMDKIQREALDSMKSFYSKSVVWVVIFTILFVVFFVGVVFWLAR